MTSPDDLLTVTQIARELDVSISTIHRWADAGRLEEAMKLDGLRGPRLFRRSSVDALRAEGAK